jgi:large subunit ribosomal protein L1
MSKRIKQAHKLVDKAKQYPLKDAVGILKNSPTVKFDESVDIAIKLNLDTKELSQSIRGSVALPHGTGKNIKVAVFCKGELANKAKAAGADIVGAEDLIAKVAEGFVGFDVAIAVPDMMKDMSRLGKILGPRGLMPSPKAQTVTNDVEKAIKEVKAGKVEFKMDKLGCINMTIGKRSFDEKNIIENAVCVFKAILHAKPAQVKGRFIRSIAISTTMGPGIRLDAAEFSI